jgi:glycine C-acetyltransferase
MNDISNILAQLKAKGLYRTLRTVESAQGPRLVVDGKEVLLLCSNDYLGLANHPRVKEAAKSAIDKYGFGSGASRLVSGSMEAHCSLEEKIAKFKGTEAALLFNSGYAANTGVISALAGRQDIVYSDRLNHASIVDGCRLSMAKVRRYRHCDSTHLEELLQTPKSGGKLLVTDGVFSMDGDIAPLKEIAALAKQYGTMLMVDDAHGVGVLGEGGRGTAEELGLHPDDIDIHMGTLGKALGTFGAYVAGSRELIDYLINSTRSFIYSTALPPSTAAAAEAALDILISEPERRERLKENAKLMRNGLSGLGFDTGNSRTPIIPLIAGSAKMACTMMESLFEEGIFAQAIRPPTVPEGSARIRVTVTSEHSKSDLKKALEAFELAGKKSGLL